MSGPNTPAANIAAKIQGAPIFRVPDQSGLFISPSMAQDAHITANAAMPDNPLLRPGLRLGTWPDEQVTK